MKLKKVSFSLKWYDAWIGCYIDTKSKRLYLCLIPFCLLTFYFVGRSTMISGIVRLYRSIMCLCGRHNWIYQPGRKNNGWCGWCGRIKD